MLPPKPSRHFERQAETSARRRALALLLAAPFLPIAALLVPAAPARAAQRVPVQALGLTDTGGEIFLQGSFKNQTQTSADGSTTTESERFFQEILELHAKGYAYHPNLLDWFADLRLGLTQELININQQTQNSNGNLLGYNVAGLFFREKPVSFSAFSSRNQQFIARDFARSTELTNSRNGAQITTKGEVPLSLMFEKVDVTEIDELRTDVRSTRHLRFTAADQRDPNRTLALAYDHEDTDETMTFNSPGGGTPTVDNLPVRRDEVVVHGAQQFGPGPVKSRVAGNVRALDRAGNFPEKLLAGDLSLNLQHTQSFSTFYRALYNQDQTDQELDKDFVGEVGATQHVFESLDITGRGVYTKHQFGLATEDIKGGFLDFAYRKKTAVGQYNASLLLGHEQTHETSPNGEINVRGEVVILADLAPVPLKQPNVLAGSVRVWNLARTIRYIENTDYTVTTLGAFTQITRTAAGSILDPQTVLVDYTVRAATDAIWDTEHVGWTNRLRFDAIPIALYYNYRLRDDQLQSGDNPGNLDKQRVHLVGAEFDYKNLDIIGEYEARRQVLFPPWNAERARARYILRLAQDVDFTVGALVEHLVYLDAQQFNLPPNRAFLDTASAYGRLGAKLQRNLLFRADAEYIQTKGRENRTLANINVGLEWAYRSLEMAITARESFYDQEKNTGTSESILFTLRRRF